MTRLDKTLAIDAPSRPQTSELAARVKRGTARLTMGGDRLRLSTGQKLKEGNRLALKAAGANMLQIVSHPFKTVGNMVAGTVGMITHPGRAVELVRDTYRKDPVDGVIQAGMVGASLAGVGALLVMGVAFGGAVFTGGASLALLPAAGFVASAAGTVGVVAMGASFVKNQVDVATAKTEAELHQQSQELGQDFSNLGMAAASTLAAKGISHVVQKVKPKNVNPSAAQRGAYRVKSQLKKDKGGEVQAPGVRVDGKPREVFREMAVKEVQAALEDSVQSKKRHLQVNDLDMGDFKGVERLGEHRMVFHGTRSEISELVRANGLKSSDIGDYGSGIYMGGAAKIGVNYADDVTIGRSVSATNKPAVYVAEMAPGKIMDFVSEKATFLEWAKTRFDPTDMTNPVNQAYAKPNVPVSKMVDNTWTRYLPDYCKEMGYDSILVRNWDGPGLDYWVVHDPKRLVLRQEIFLDTPKNARLVPSGFEGPNATIVQATTQAEQQNRKAK